MMITPGRGDFIAFVLGIQNPLITLYSITLEIQEPFFSRIRAELDMVQLFSTAHTTYQPHSQMAERV